MLSRLYDIARDPSLNPLLGLFIKDDPSRPADRHTVSHRDAMRDPRDATVLYDDIWGAP